MLALGWGSGRLSLPMQVLLLAPTVPLQPPFFICKPEKALARLGVAMGAKQDRSPGSTHKNSTQVHTLAYIRAPLKAEGDSHP